MVEEVRMGGLDMDRRDGGDNLGEELCRHEFPTYCFSVLILIKF